MDIGVYATAGLRDAGLTPRRIQAEIDEGNLRRVRRGWYASPGADPEACLAVRVGGRLTCTSGARHYGVWVPHTGVHVAVPGQVRRPAGPEMRLHRQASLSWPETQPILSLPDCLSHLLRHHDAETALMVLESATRLGKIQLGEARDLIAAAPERRRRRLQHFCPRAESGTETRVRLWFNRRRVQVRAQVSIAGLGRVDLLVGDSLILECDSHQHHANPQQYLVDRRRDLIAAGLGYRTLRLTYGQVMEQWDVTQRVLTSLLAADAHRMPVLGDPWLPDLGPADF